MNLMLSSHTSSSLMSLSRRRVGSLILVGLVRMWPISPGISGMFRRGPTDSCLHWEAFLEWDNAGCSSGWNLIFPGTFSPQYWTHYDLRGPKKTPKLNHKSKISVKRIMNLGYLLKNNVFRNAIWKRF